MRVVVVCSDLGVRVPGTKGASIHLDAITRALASIGHEVLLVGVAGHGDPPPDVESLLLPHPGRTSGLRRELRKLAFTRHLTRTAGPVVAKFRPDVIYERLALFGTAGRHLAVDTGARHVLEINALLSEEEAAWRSLRLKRLARRREDAVLTAVDVRVAVSDELAGRVQRRCDREVAVVPNGVELELFEDLPSRQDARRAVRLPPDVPLIGFTGSLRPWHGLHVALDALAHLSDVELAVAGNGDLRTELTEQARGLGVAERVHWLGQVPHDRIPWFLAALDVAIAPYPPLDGFAFSPLKVFEYLAAGTPVIASAIGQLPEVVGPFGTLVPPGDAGALADAVRSVMADLGDARRVAAAGRQWVFAHHGWRQRAQQLTTLFVAEADRAVAS